MWAWRLHPASFPSLSSWKSTAEGPDLIRYSLQVSFSHQSGAMSNKAS